MLSQPKVKRFSLNQILLITPETTTKTLIRLILDLGATKTSTPTRIKDEKQQDIKTIFFFVSSDDQRQSNLLQTAFHQDHFNQSILISWKMHQKLLEAFATITKSFSFFSVLISLTLIALIFNNQKTVSSSKTLSTMQDVRSRCCFTPSRRICPLRMTSVTSSPSCPCLPFSLRRTACSLKLNLNQMKKTRSKR